MSKLRDCQNESCIYDSKGMFSEWQKDFLPVSPSTFDDSLKHHLWCCLKIIWTYLGAPHEYNCSMVFLIVMVERWGCCCEWSTGWWVLHVPWAHLNWICQENLIKCNGWKLRGIVTFLVWRHSYASCLIS